MTPVCQGYASALSSARIRCEIDKVLRTYLNITEYSWNIY